MSTSRQARPSRKSILSLTVSAFALFLVFQTNTARADELSISNTSIRLAGIEGPSSLLLEQDRIHMSENGYLRLHDSGIYNHVSPWLAFGLTYHSTPKDETNSSCFSNQAARTLASNMGTEPLNVFDLLPTGFMVTAMLSI